MFFIQAKRQCFNGKNIYNRAEGISDKKPDIQRNLFIISETANFFWKERFPMIFNLPQSPSNIP